MQQSKLIELLNRVLKSNGRKLSKENQYLWWSPFINHHKPKLEINIDSYKWHCWVSNNGGHNLFQLFRKIKADNIDFKDLESIIGSPKSYKPKSYEGEITEKVELPREFKFLYYKSDNLIYKHALKYLKSRNISFEEIIRYNIGYVDGGVYKNRIIIPSYDKNGVLNYFVARDIFPNSIMKYKNPPVSRNIIPFELFVSWEHPIVLCEGVFDAIAIKKNAIPLLGKFPSKKLVMKIIESGVTDIYIALDEDAKEDALKLSEFMIGYGKNVYLMNMDAKDPSDLGFREFWKHIEVTKQTNFSDLIRSRLNG